MANFNTTTKIIRGAVTDTEDSGTAGTVAKAVNDYLETINDAKLVSMTSTLAGGPDNLIVVIVTKD